MLRRWHATHTCCELNELKMLIYIFINFSLSQNEWQQRRIRHGKPMSVTIHHTKTPITSDIMSGVIFQWMLKTNMNIFVFDWDFRPNWHDVGTIWHCLLYIHTTKSGSITKLMVLSESSYAKTYGWTSKSSFYVYRFGRYETLCEKTQIWRPSWIFGASNIPIWIPMIYLHLNII